MIALEVAGSPFTVAENTFGRLFVRTRPIRLLDPPSSTLSLLCLLPNLGTFFTLASKAVRVRRAFYRDGRPFSDSSLGDVQSSA